MRIRKTWIALVAGIAAASCAVEPRPPLEAYDPPPLEIPTLGELGRLPPAEPYGEGGLAFDGPAAADLEIWVEQARANTVTAEHMRLALMSLEREAKALAYAGRLREQQYLRAEKELAQERRDAFWRSIFYPLIAVLGIASGL